VAGATFARKVAEKFQAENKPFNYPLVAAAGYSGMMCWHGGLSGSAPLSLVGEVSSLPFQTSPIPLNSTLLSSPNLLTFGLLALVVPIGFWILGKKYQSNTPSISSKLPIRSATNAPIRKPNILSRIFGAGILLLGVYTLFSQESAGAIAYLSLNKVNFLLLGMGLLLHPNLDSYTGALQNAGHGAISIIIQFPFYAGILGILTYSNLLSDLTLELGNFATSANLPLLTFFSAGLVNFFVPSGGGQWAVQGPILVELSQQTGTDLGKVVMAFAYGDQITNMIQPFWALPLLSITGVKAKEILPYSLFCMLMGILIFVFSHLVIY
jgi:short-chain fatty acids transporter